MPKYYNYSELKESKIIYDKKPPAFGVVITLMTLIFVVAALMWAGFSVKIYVVKATGIVADQYKLNIMNTVSAEIESINVQEGQAVKEGDIILTLDAYQVELQIEQIREMTELYEKRSINTNMLVQFVNGYLLDDKETQKNPFDANNAELAKLYTDAETFISYVKQQIEAGNATDESTESEPFTQEKLDEIKGQYLSQQGIYTALDEYAAQIVQYKSQIKMYEDSLDAYTIYAGADGVIHLTAGLTVGTMLQAGTLLGNIASGNAENLVFTTSVSATDRSKLEIGSTVEIAVSGVMQTEYGVLTGKVVAIDNDSTQTEDGNVFYLVTVKPDTTSLTNSKGNTVELTAGMIAEVRIKYDETSWLKWIIEQIGVKFK